MKSDGNTLSTPASASKRDRGNPDKPLRKACAKPLRELNEVIAQRQLDLGLARNTQVLKLLTHLATKGKSQQPAGAEPEASKPKRSLATEWANEPEWIDPAKVPSAL